MNLSILIFTMRIGLSYPMGLFEDKTEKCTKKCPCLSWY